MSRRERRGVRRGDVTWTNNEQEYARDLCPVGTRGARNRAGIALSLDSEEEDDHE